MRGKISSNGKVQIRRCAGFVPPVSSGYEKFEADVIAKTVAQGLPRPSQSEVLGIAVRAGLIRLGYLDKYGNEPA